MNNVIHVLSDVLAGLPAGDLQTNLEGALLLARKRFFNQAPLAAPVQDSTSETGQITGTISGRDPEGDPVTYRVVTNPQFGTVEVGADGLYTYNPAEGYAGSDKFTVEIACDGAGLNIVTPRAEHGSTQVVVNVGTDAASTPFSGAIDASLGLSGATARISLAKKFGRYTATVALTNTTPDTQVMWVDAAGRWGMVSVTEVASSHWDDFAAEATGAGRGVTLGVVYQTDDGIEQAVVLSHADATLTADGQVVFSGDLAPDPVSKTGYTDDFWDIVGQGFKSQYESFRAQYIEATPFIGTTSFDVSGADVYADTYSLSEFKAHVNNSPGERFATTDPTAPTAAAGTAATQDGQPVDATAALKDLLFKGITFIQDARSNANGGVASWDPSLATFSNGTLTDGIGPSQLNVEITAQFDDPQGLILGFADGSVMQWNENPTGTASLQSDGYTVLDGKWETMRDPVANYAPLSSPSETQPYPTSAVTSIVRFGADYIIGTQGGQIYRCATSSSGRGCQTPLSAGPSTSTLKVGETLAIGQSLVSLNGAYSLGLEADGNLALRNFRGDLLWSRGGSGVTRAVLGTDGNFVLDTGVPQSTKWETGTAAVSPNVTTLPTVTVANTTVTEGNSGNRKLTFTVQLSTPSDRKVTVGYKTAGGTATASTDYQTASGTVIFAPGETSKTVDVVVTGDTSVELDETVTFVVESPKGETGGKLVVENDGNVVLYDSDGETLWDSKTKADEPAGAWTKVGLASGPVATILPFTNTATGKSTVLLAATSWSKNSIGNATNSKTQVYEWDGQTLQNWADWGDDEGVLTAAATYQDGTRAVFALTDETVRLWDGNSWTRLELPRSGAVSAVMAVKDSYGSGFVVGQRGTDGAFGASASMSEWTGTEWQDLGKLDSTVTAFAPVTFGDQAGSFVAGLEDGTLKASYVKNGERTIEQLQDGQKWGDMKGKAAAPPVTTIIPAQDGSFVVGLSNGAVWRFSGNVVDALQGYQSYPGWTEMREQYLTSAGTLGGGATVGTTTWGWTGWPNIPNGFNSTSGKATLLKSGDGFALLANEKDGLPGESFNEGQMSKTLITMYEAAGVPQVNDRGTPETSDDLLITDSAGNPLLGAGWTDKALLAAVDPNSYGIGTTADPLFGSAAFQPNCQATGCVGKYNFFSFVTDPEGPISIPIYTQVLGKANTSGKPTNSIFNWYGQNNGTSAEKTAVAPPSVALKFDAGVTAYGYYYTPDSVWELTNPSKYVSAACLSSVSWGPRLSLQLPIQQEGAAAGDLAGDWSIDVPTGVFDFTKNLFGPVVAGPGLFQVTASGGLAVTTKLTLPPDFGSQPWYKRKLDLTLYNTDTTLTTFNVNSTPGVVKTYSFEGPSSCENGGSGISCASADLGFAGSWVLDASDVAQISGLEVGFSYIPSIAATYGWYLPQGLIPSTGYVANKVNGVAETLSIVKIGLAFDNPLAFTMRVPIGRTQATGTITDDDPLPPTPGDPSAAIATGTITNDDSQASPVVSIANATVVEGDSGTTAMQFTVSLSKPATVPVTVEYQTLDVAPKGAKAGSDYVATSGTLSFAPGETSKTITVDVIGDTAVEGDEQFTIKLKNETGAVLADNKAQALISASGNLAWEAGILSGFINALTAKDSISLYKVEAELNSSLNV